MKTNVHSFERVFRVVVGLFLMSLAFWGPRSPWFLLGIIPVFTGLSGWCPMYTMLGLSTCGSMCHSNQTDKIGSDFRY